MAVTDETCIAKIYAGPIHYALGIRAANRPCVGHHQKYESDTKLFVCLLSRKTADALMVIYYVTRGTFRFTTGSQNKGEVKIKTPYGTLGTRG